MMKKFLFVVLSVFCFMGNALSFPVLSGRVVDDAHILTQQQKNDLEQILKQVEPHQVVAVSLSSLDGKEIEEYGYQLGRYWGIGRRGENDGVLVLIAPNERQLRIEVGYGLEHILTDAKSSEIVNRIMMPLARQGKYGEALIQGSVAVIDVLGGRTIEQPEPIKIPGFLPVIFGLMFMLLFIMFGGKSVGRGGGFRSGGFGGGFHGGGGSFGGGGASGRF